MSLKDLEEEIIASGVARITLADINVTDFAISPTDATAGYQLESDGDITRQDPGNSDAGDWIVPRLAAGGSYEVRATLQAGSLDAGSDAVGSYLALSATRLWRCRVTALGQQTATLLIEIRRVGTTQVLESCTVNLDASVEL